MANHNRGIVIRDTRRPNACGFAVTNSLKMFKYFTEQCIKIQNFVMCSTGRISLEFVFLEIYFHFLTNKFLLGYIRFKGYF